MDEILGYHLEQAARYKAQFGEPDTVLARRAGEHLAAAGRKAFSRDGAVAVRALLERALAQTRPLRFDVVLELDLARAVYYSESAQAAARVAETVAERAREAGDEAGGAVAHLMAATRRCQLGELANDELEMLVDAALPLAELTGDHALQARVSRLDDAGLLRWGRQTNVVEVLMAGQAAGAFAQVQHLIGPANAHRLNPPAPAELGTLDRCDARELIGKAAHHSRVFAPLFQSEFAAHFAGPFTPFHGPHAKAGT